MAHMETKKKKILIIEDDANLLFGLSAKLSADGFATATNAGTDNIEMIKKQVRETRPDFIILDLVLPQVDGFTLLSALKAEPELVDVPILVFTNLSDQDSRERGRRSGASFYVLKSQLNQEELVAKVVDLIKKNKQ